MVNGMFNQQNYLLAQKLLDASVVRHETLAGNLANINTRNYHRKDVSADFQTELRAAFRAGDMARVREAEPEVKTDPNAKNFRADGNNVEMDSEMMAISNNAMEYEFLTQYLSNNFNQIRAAITGSAQ